MRYHVTFHIGAALTLCSLWFFLVYTPSTEKQLTIQTQAALIQQQLTDFDMTMKELPKSVQASRDLVTLKSNLNSSLYAKDEILALFRQISEDAVSHNLTLTEISPPVLELLHLNRVSEMADEPQFLNITLDLRGQYIEFGKYITHLESTPYFRKINFCHIRGSQAPTPEISLSVSFKALIGSAPESA